MGQIYDALEELTGNLLTAFDDFVSAKFLFHLTHHDKLNVLEKISERLDQQKNELKIAGFSLAETTIEDMLFLLNHVRNHCCYYYYYPN